MGDFARRVRKPPTEEERFIAGNRMVRAAIGALGEHTADESAVAMRVVRAVRAAKSARTNEAKKLGVDVDFLPETIRSVCAAFDWWSSDIRVSPGEVNAESMASDGVYGFARGISAVLTASAVHEMLTCEDMLEYKDDGAEVLLGRYAS